jgi:hypothetical protein
MSELATIRWGDYQGFGITPAGEVAFNQTTKQLVMAQWHVPMSWNVILVAFPQFDTTETGTMTVAWLFTIGAGAGSLGEIPLFTMTLAPVAGIYSLQQQQQLIPAQGMQIRARLTSTNLVATKGQQITVGAFVAPNNAEAFAEVDAMKRALDSGLGDEASGERRRWAPMGFEEDPLRYQPYRRR